MKVNRAAGIGSDVAILRRVHEMDHVIAHHGRAVRPPLHVGQDVNAARRLRPGHERITGNQRAFIEPRVVIVGVVAHLEHLAAAHHEVIDDLIPGARLPVAAAVFVANDDARRRIVPVTQRLSVAGIDDDVAAHHVIAGPVDVDAHVSRVDHHVSLDGQAGAAPVDVDTLAQPVGNDVFTNDAIAYLSEQE